MDQNRRDVEERLGAILQECGPALRRVIARICPLHLGVTVDEIEQEVRMKIWRALEDGREIAFPSSYIQRIAVTTTIDAIRRVKARREEPLLAEQDDPGGSLAPQSSLATADCDSPLRRAELAEVSEKIQAALSTLSDERQRAVGLYLQGFTSEEIAVIFGWSGPKARNLTYRGLSDLRRLLRAHGIEYEAD